MRKRIILHIDMDAFFPAIEERENPQFKGLPIIVGADPKKGRGRGVVSSASYEARKYGIKSGMPISKAYQLCPKAIFLPVNIELYKKVSEKIMKIVKKYSPKWEIVSLDEAYLDLSNYLAMANKVDKMEGWKMVENLAKKLKREILKKENLTSTVGIGPNKTIAKMATNTAKPRSRILTAPPLAEGRGKIGEALSKFHYGAKPDGLLIIRSKMVKTFLDPLDIEELPGIGPKTAEKLRKLKIKATKDLKKLSKSRLENLFGKVGLTIYQRARGIDEEEVLPEEVIKSIGKEKTFERDTRDPEIIFNTFDKIINNVYQELLENKFNFRTITVICRYSGFETHTKSKTLENSTNNLEILKKEAKRLLLKFLIEKPKLIRLIGLRLSGLS